MDISHIGDPILSRKNNLGLKKYHETDDDKREADSIDIMSQTWSFLAKKSFLGMLATKKTSERLIFETWL